MDKNKLWLKVYDSFSYVTWRVIVTNSDSYAASTGHQVMFGEDDHKQNCVNTKNLSSEQIIIFTLLRTDDSL